MKKILFLFLFGSMFTLLNAQTTFRESYDIASFDLAGGMVQNPAGEFVMAGTNATFIPLYGNITKLATNGNIVWSKAYTGGIATQLLDIKNVSPGNGGGYIACGGSSSGGAVLLRIDDNGNIIWAKRYALPDRPSDDASSEYANAVIETSDGGFLVGGGVDFYWDGISGNTVDTTSAFGFKVNSAGVLQWGRVWTISVTNPDEHYINDVAESADGYFFVGVSSEGTGTLSSNGDYPSQALVVKTDFTGTLQYIRRHGAGGSSQSFDAAIRNTAGQIIIGGADDVNAFITSMVGTGGTPTQGAFSRRINGSAFGNTYLISDIMQNSDGNYSAVMMRIAFLSVALNTYFFKINASTNAVMIGKSYAPIGLTAILPEGGLASDQGFFAAMTDQQMTGFNYNIIRTDANGDLNDPDAGCPSTTITPGTAAYTLSFSTPTSSTFTNFTESTFTPTVTNLTPVKTEHCLNVVCTPPAAPTASASPATICSGSSSTITSTAPAGVTFYYYTTSTGGTAFASGASTVVSPATTTTYYVESDDNSNPGCKSSRTAVTVTVVQPPNAGTNATTSVCSNGSAVNLFSLLTGSPNTGGTWSGPSSLTGGSNGTFTPGTNTAGTYTYTVNATAPCVGSDQSTVVVTVVNTPNAGTDASTTLCSSASAVNLFSLLTGSPQSGGTWSGPSSLTGGSSGTFTPGTNTAGTYTYTVNATSPCVGSDQSTVTVTIVNAPNAGSDNTITVCSNGSATNLFALLGGSAQSGGTWSGTTSLTGGSLGTFTPGTNSAGTYTYTVNSTSPCTGSDQATVIVTVNTAANAGTNGSISVCSNNAPFNLFSILGGSPQAIGTWSGPSVLTGGSNGTFTPGTNTAGTYTYTVTGSAPCSNATATVTVSVTTAPSTGTSASVSVCSDGSAINLFSVLGGTPNAGGTWSGPSSLTGGSSGTFTPGTNTAGTYTYTINGTAPCSGVFSSTVTVTVNTAPNSGTSSSTSVCSNGSAINLFSLLGGSPSTNGSWSGPSTLTGGSLGTFTPGTNTAGIYTYTVNGIAPCAATSVATITVTVNTAVTAGTNGSTTVCSNDAALNLFSLLGGTPNSGGTWSGPSALTGGSSGTFTPGTNTAGTYTYTVNGTSPCPNATATVTIAVTTAPSLVNPTASSNTICEGQSTTISATALNASTFNVYDASSGGNLLGTTPLSVSPTNTTTYYIEAVGSTGCTQSGGLVAITITVIPIDNPSWTSPGATCVQAGIINLDPLITGTTGGTWSGTGVSGNTFDPTGLAGQTISITYTVGATPCEQTSTQTITVQSVISGAWTTPGTICESDGIINLNSLITGTAGGSWSGTGVTGNTFDPTGLSGTVSVTYSVGVNPCIDIVTQDIIVNASPFDPVVAATDTSVCAGESVTITASGSGSGVTYTIYDAATGGNIIGTTPYTFVPLSTDTYYIIAENANGCVNLGGAAEVDITVNALPIADAGNNVQICPGDNASITATGGGTYLWSTTETTASITVTPSTDTEYFVTVTNTAGCSAMDSVTVTIYTGASSLVAVLDSTFTEENEAVSIDVSSNDAGNINSVSILINPSNGTATASGTTVTYTPNADFIGTDTLVYLVCDAFCTSYCDTAIVIIRVVENIPIFVPSGFSPNSDGINDEFVIEGLDDYPENELYIYNRWGELVYYSKPYNNDWSGESNNNKLKLSGDDVVDGTYFYVLKLTEADSRNGYIELRRR